MLSSLALTTDLQRQLETAARFSKSDWGFVSTPKHTGRAMFWAYGSVSPMFLSNGDMLADSTAA